MAKTEKNWALTSYTNDTWTDLVAEAGTIAALAICNTGASDVTVEVRLEDGGSPVVTVLAPAVLTANESFVLDIRSINITGTQALQIKADVAGAEFLASGVV